VATSVAPVICSARKSTACCPTGWARGGGSGHVYPGELEHTDCIRGRLLDRLVAGHGRHPAQLELRAPEREQERDRVVVTGVAVEEDRRAHAVRI
jgi:hypothetical protein